MNVLTDLFACAVQLYPGQMFPVLYIFYFSSSIPLRMAISPQCEPAEQSESGKSLKGHIFKSKKGTRSVWVSDVLLQRTHMSIQR